MSNGLVSDYTGSSILVSVERGSPVEIESYSGADSSVTTSLVLSSSVIIDSLAFSSGIVSIEAESITSVSCA